MTGNGIPLENPTECWSVAIFSLQPLAFSLQRLLSRLRSNPVKPSQTQSNPVRVFSNPDRLGRTLPLPTIHCGFFGTIHNLWWFPSAGTSKPAAKPVSSLCSLRSLRLPSAGTTKPAPNPQPSNRPLSNPVKPSQTRLAAPTPLAKARGDGGSEAKADPSLHHSISPHSPPPLHPRPSASIRGSPFPSPTPLRRKTLTMQRRTGAPLSWTASGIIMPNTFHKNYPSACHFRRKSLAYRYLRKMAII
jgi:hypothetical protein